ncbi:hypothetical protein J1614_009069 [Plenodomus biglobosus]|nr:hypothetical protein J1614_009069 [Plenodomus biglobosus]
MNLSLLFYRGLFEKECLRSIYILSAGILFSVLGWFLPWPILVKLCTAIPLLIMAMFFMVIVYGATADLEPERRQDGNSIASQLAEATDLDEIYDLYFRNNA